MPDYSAGSASVRVRPNADDFIRDLRRKLSSFRDPGFDVDVTADTTKFGQKVAAAKRDAAKPVETQLEVDLREAENQLRALRIRERAKKLDLQIDVEADPARAEMQLRLLRAREEARKIELGVNVDASRANSQIDGLRKQLQSLGRSDLLRVNVGAGLLAGLGPALTGLAQVAAAIQQIAQAGLALPGVFAGATASVGTLVVGLSGISDAYEAVSSAASSAGQDQQASARAAASASNQLRNANVDLGRAYDDVARATRDARQELTDLRVEQRGGMIDESRAILEAQKAREDLMSGNYSDVRDQVLRVAEADQRLIEVRSRNAQTAEKLNEANAKGIAGNDGVVAANERVVRSQQQVADAQNAVTDSGSKMSAAQRKADETMAKLGPNAQAVVRTLVELTPEFEKVQQSISQPLLEGKAEEFERFFTTMRPLVEQGGAEIARGWNQNITALFDSVGSGEGRGLIDRILGNTGEAQARLSKAIDPLVKGVGTLVAAGTDALPRLADGLTGVLERFRNFIQEADRDGSLDKWINDGIDGLASVGESVLNIGKSFTAITTAAGGGQSFLAWLQDATGRLQTFLNSAEGQEQLKKFFKESADFYHNTLRPVLEDIPGLLKGIHDGAVTYIGGLMKTISPLTEFLRDHPGLVQGAVAAYAAWKTIDGVTSLMDNLKSLNTMLGVTLPDSASKGASKMSMALGPIAALAAMIVAVDPEKQLTDDGSLLNGPKNGNWGEVAFGDAWPWIKEKLGIGGGGGNPAAQTTPGAPGVPFGGQPVQGPGVTQPPAPALPAGPAIPSHAPTAQPLDPNNPFAGYAKGGPTPTGRGPGPTGGWLAEIHSNEWILPEQARRAVGDQTLWALTAGRRFQTGGYVDEHGNPITPGVAPGPAAPIIAPNPLGNTGGISGIFGQVASGLQNPINMGTQLLSGAVSHGQQAGTPGAATPSPSAAFGSNLLSGIVPGLNIGGAGAASGSTGGGMLPGLAGLFQAGGNQGLQQQWMSQTGNWVANWGANTLLQFGQTLLGGALNFFGMGGLMQHPVLQGIGQTVGHFGSVAGQLAAPQTGALPGGLGPGSVLGAGGGTVTVLDATGTPVTIDMPGAATSASASSAGGGAAPAKGGWAPSKGPEGGLQNYTLQVKRAIESAFPQVLSIGGVRKDALKWHPNGLAIDVMVSPGGNNDPTTPEGLALGNQIYAWVMAHKDKFGVDYVMWQEKDHYNHLHINTTGGGYPGSGSQSGPAAPIKSAIPGFEVGGPTPPGRKKPFPAILHGDEFVISARGRAKVPDSFLHALNTGLIDPADLPQFYDGGIPAALVARNVPAPPRPPLPRVPDAKTITPPAPPKLPVARPALPPIADPRQPAAPPPPVAQQPPAAAPPQSAAAIGPSAGAAPPQGIVAPQDGIDHTLPWINQAITSTASTLGNIAATAASMGAGMSGGGGAAGGLAGSMAAGLFQQGGKVATKVANVVSSALVGSVPGSFTDTPSGQVMRAEQNRPSLAEYRGGNTYNVQGYEPQVISREIQAHEALDRQARLANIPVRR